MQLPRSQEGAGSQPSLGYCFDYEQADSWSNHIDAICALAIATVLIGVGLAAMLHISLWMLEAI